MQVFKTHCIDCGEEVKSVMGVLSDNSDIIIDFIEDMEFYCKSCKATTIILIEKHTID